MLGVPLCWFKPLEGDFFKMYIFPPKSLENGLVYGSGGGAISYTLKVKVQNILFFKRTETNTKKVSPRTLPGQFFFGNLCLRRFFKNPEKMAKISNFFNINRPQLCHAWTDFNQTWCGHPSRCQCPSLTFSSSLLKLYGEPVS